MVGRLGTNCQETAISFGFAARIENRATFTYCIWYICVCIFIMFLVLFLLLLLLILIFLILAVVVAVVNHSGSDVVYNFEGVCLSLCLLDDNFRKP